MRQIEREYFLLDSLYEVLGSTRGLCDGFRELRNGSLPVMASPAQAQRAAIMHHIDAKGSGTLPANHPWDDIKFEPPLNSSAVGDVYR